jgi:2,4-dienoyl-CoA reductase-like NADH-dependent reductase (Old Yellow Enzyme family)
MSKLFEPAKIGGMELRNRFVRSATWEGLATADGAVTPKLADTIAALAQGGVGLIISGHAYVRPEGQAGPGQIGAHRDELLPGLRQMASAAHDHGAKILLQLAHAGCFAPKELTGVTPFAVSASVRLDDTARRELTAGDIRDLVQAYADAAGRAKAAGFDGVQIHSAHGYLLSQFLSPVYNRRTDPYGGVIENRVRAHREVLAAVRRAVGPGMPVLVKINGDDFVDGGLTARESAAAALMLQEQGLDAVEVSGGWLRNLKLSPARVGIKSVEKEAYHRPQAEVFRQTIGIPLILVGGVRSFETSEQLVDEGVCDFIAMSRPLIREPDLIRRWQSGDRRKSACRSDNLCFEPARKGEGIYCVTAEREKPPG